MNYLLLATIFFPILMGALMGIIKFNKRTSRAIYVFIATLITSLLVLITLVSGQNAIASDGRIAEETLIYLFSLAEGYDICFAVTGLSTVFAGLVAVMWPLAVLYAIEYMEHEGGEQVFFAFYTMTYGVTLGIAFSGSLTTMYLFYEMLTLVTLPLVTHGMSKKSVRAGRTYVLYSIGGAALAFVGLVTVTTLAGTNVFTYGGVLGTSVSDETIKTVLRVIYVLTFFGFGVKATVFPFYAWLPAASGAPTPVTALLHAVAVVNAGAFGIFRSTYYIFGTDFLAGTWAQAVVMIFAEITIVMGSLNALKERHIKRRLAFSTVSNLSYMVLGVTLMTPEGVAGGLAHFVFHGIMKIALFFVAGIVLCKYEIKYIDQIYGLGRKMRITFVSFTIAAVSLIGVPPTVGFVSKWYLMTAAAKEGSIFAYAGMGALIISALLTTVYLLSIFIRAYFPGRGFKWESIDYAKDPGWLMVVPLIILSVLIIVIGVFSLPMIDYFQAIGKGLI